MDRGNLLFELPQQIGPQRPRGTVHRPQPIRDSILAYLDEPRTAKAIAVHIDRRTSIATGHLRAMRLRELVVRLSWGVWVRRDQCDNAPEHSTILRTKSAQKWLPDLSKPRKPAVIKRRRTRKSRRPRK